MAAKKKITPEEKRELALKVVRRSRVDLISNHTFFGDLAFGMTVHIDDTLNPATAATDGIDLYYHPDYILGLSHPEVVFVTGHEVLHAAFMHIDRRGKRDPLIWNIAADVVVNQLLVDNNVGKMPNNLIYDPQLYAKGGGIVTKIYDLLDKNDPRKSFDDFKPRDGKKVPPNAVKMRGRLEQAFERARNAGNVSGSLEAFVKNMTDAKVRWEDELFMEIVSNKGAERTYARRNRRLAPQGFIVPGIEGEVSGDLVFGIDCSGSTSDAMVGQCGAEVKRAMEALRPERTHIIYWDTEIKKVEVYGPDELDFEVKAYGRGGTAVGCVWDYIADNEIEPSNCIIATDLLFGGDYGTRVPEYPVIWCVMDGPHVVEAPFGRIINTGAIDNTGYDLDDDF